jgi:hypothetical protein
MRIGLVVVMTSVVATTACTSGPETPCDRSLLFGDHGFTLASPAGTQFAPTVVFADADDGGHPDSCHYSRNQGDEVCTEDGGWVDNNPGERAGTITVTPFDHACGSFQTGSSYTLQYSFDHVPGILWIMAWSNND